MVKSMTCKGSQFIYTILTAVAIFSCLKTRNEISREFSTIQPTLLVEAFAVKRGAGFGGSGAGFGAGQKPKNRNKESKKIKRQGNLASMTTSDNKKNEPRHNSITSREEEPPELDKWGLPIATPENIFPPLPPSTKILPIDTLNDHYLLSEIKECIKGHVDLGDLCRSFNEQGQARIQNHDGSIMRLRLLHRSPPVLKLSNFLTADECRDVRKLAERRMSTHRVGSATFRGALSARTSTSWFCRYVDLPVLIAKAHHILGIPLETMEEPQIVRYKVGEEFSWHYDEIPPTQLSNGGQRLATLLVYLTDVPSSKGGGTRFRDLKESSASTSPLVMQPQTGSALLFFPSFADGSPDDRTLHKSEILKRDKKEDDHKWIVQMWTHERSYQASLPTDNSNEAARHVVKETSVKLGLD